MGLGPAAEPPPGAVAADAALGPAGAVPPTPGMGPVPGVQPPPAEPAAAPPKAAAPQEDAGPRRVIGAVLLSYQDDAYGKQWVLHDGENLVGRAETNVKCDVPIAHGTTSTRHATIRCAEGEVTIQDMKSTNGTYHNGRRITANTPAQLRSGDKLRFGGYSAYIFFAPSRQ